MAPSAVYGYYSRVSGSITVADAGAWLTDLKTIIGRADNCGAFLDIRDLTCESLVGMTPHLVELMNYSCSHGIIRAAAITPCARGTQYTRRLAWRNNVYETHRYITAVPGADWQQAAVAWVEQAIEPRNRPSASAPGAAPASTRPPSRGTGIGRG